MWTIVSPVHAQQGYALNWDCSCYSKQHLRKREVKWTGYWFLMYHHTGYDESLNPFKLNVGFGTFITLLEMWKKPFRQIKKIYKSKCIIWIDLCLNNYVWKMVVFQHLYCLRSMKWEYFKLWGHTLSGILISRKPGKLIKLWIFYREVSFIFHIFDPLSKTQMFAKTQLAEGRKLGGFFS